MTTKTPEQVAAETYRTLSNLPLKLSGGRLREIMAQAIEADRAQRTQIHQDWRDDQENMREAERVDVEVMAVWTRDGKEEVLFGTGFSLTVAQAVGMFQGIGEASE